MNFNKIPILLGLLAFASYSVADAIGKYSLNIQNIDYMAYMVVINFVGVVLSLIFGFKKYHSKVFYIPKQEIKYIGIRSLLNALNLLGATYAVSVLPLEVFYSLIFISPLFATILAYFLLKEHVSKSVIAALFVGFLGIAIVLQPWKFANFSSEYISGLFVASLLPLCIANIAVINRKFLKQVQPITAVFYSAFFVTSVCLVVIFTQNIDITITFKESLYPVSGGFFIFFGAYFFLVALQKGKVQSVAITQYTQFAWAIIFGAIIFNHTPNTVVYIGMALVVCSNLINLAKK